MLGRQEQRILKLSPGHLTLFEIRDSPKGAIKKDEDLGDEQVKGSW